MFDCMSENRLTLSTLRTDTLPMFHRLQSVILWNPQAVDSNMPVDHLWIISELDRQIAELAPPRKRAYIEWNFLAHFVSSVFPREQEKIVISGSGSVTGYALKYSFKILSATDGFAPFSICFTASRRPREIAFSRSSGEGVGSA